MGFGANTFLLIEAKSEGINFSNADQIIDKYSIAINIYMMIINILVFGLLALYLDLIFPNEFGKKLHPLFCIPKFR